MNEDWFWEGNIVRCVSNYLDEQGWSIEKVADTAMRERGHDIHARRNNDILIVEVKGFPSKMHARGEKKGQPKTTVPATQARHWFSEALLSVVLAQAEYPDAITAIAVPYFPTYGSLIKRTRNAFIKLGIVVYVVNKEGVVEMVIDS